LRKKFKKKYKFKNTSKEEAKREAELEVRQEARREARGEVEVEAEAREERSSPQPTRDRRQGLRSTQVLRPNKNSWTQLITTLMPTMLDLTSLPIKMICRQFQDFILRGPRELANMVKIHVHVHDLQLVPMPPMVKDSWMSLITISEKATTSF